MHRRRRRFLVLAAGLLAARPVLAVDLLEGVDYSLIPQQPVAPGRRIQVVEFFYYGCRWCNELQPYLEEWLNRKPADVDFRYQPAIRSKRWLVLTKAFFALQAMGEVQRLHARHVGSTKRRIVGIGGNAQHRIRRTFRAGETLLDMLAHLLGIHFKSSAYNAQPLDLGRIQHAVGGGDAHEARENFLTQAKLATGDRGDLTRILQARSLRPDMLHKQAAQFCFVGLAFGNEQALESEIF